MAACTPSVYEVFDHQKTDLLISLLNHSAKMTTVVVFLRSRENVHALTSALSAAGISVDSVHGNKKPELRERTIKELLEGKFRVLVATESVVRATNLAKVGTVIYFEFPEKDADYLDHLETAERVLSFSTQDEHRLLLKLDKLVPDGIPRERLEGFPYATQPKNKRGAGGGNKTQSKPLQHKKPKLKNKGPRRKTGRTRKR